MPKPSLSKPSPSTASLSKPSLALNNLRTFAILLVLAVHASVAYLGSSPTAPIAFDDPPFRWRALPIVDGDRFFGFDIFCAHQDTYLITLLFFVSGLFVWGSLARKGAWHFVRDRIVRIAIPFALAVYVLMPLAHYPVYAATASDPSVAAYGRHFMALPLWPSGPPWFLWVLFSFNVGAAVLWQYARGPCEAFGHAAKWLGARPAAFVTVLLAVSALAYVPLALALTPWAWHQTGPFAFQESRPLLYAVWFFAGTAVGANGIEQGVFAPGGALARRWRTALVAAFAAFALWLTCAAFEATAAAPPLSLRVLEALAFVPCCTASCLFMLAVFLRFFNRPIRLLDALCPKAYGMYLVHYLFSIWLQFMLLGLVLGTGGAILKGVIVFLGTAALSYASVALGQRFIAAAGTIGRRDAGTAETAVPS